MAIEIIGGEDAQYSFSARTLSTIPIIDMEETGSAPGGPINPIGGLPYRFWTIVGGVDAAKFQIDIDTGILRFVDSPDNTNPQDFDGDNVYSVVIQVENTFGPGAGGPEYDTQTVHVTVTPPQTNTLTLSEDAVHDGTNGIYIYADVLLNAAPGVLVDQMTALRLTSTSPRLAGLTGENIGWAQPNPGATLLAISFRDKINLLNLGETATFEVDYKLTNGDAATLTVVINGTDDAAQLYAFHREFGENALGPVAIFKVTDPDTDLPAYTYSITGGEDAAKFTIDPATGALRFVTPPDFENPTDIGGDNIYEVDIRATGSDQSVLDYYQFQATITNANENSDYTPVNFETILYTDPGSESRPAIAALADGRSVAVFTVYDNALETGFGRGTLTLKFLDANGNPLPGQIAVNSNKHAQNGEVEVLSNGDFIVGWREIGIAGGSVHVQQYHPDGTLVGTQIDIPIGQYAYFGTYDEQYPSAPALTATIDGGFAIAWDFDFSRNPTGKEAILRVYDSNRTQVGTDTTLDANGGLREDMPRLATLQDGTIVAVWAQGVTVSNYSMANQIVWTQQFSASGAALGPALSLDNVQLFSGRSFPDIVALVGGGYVVSWHDLAEDGPAYTDTHQSKLQFFNDAGVAQGAPVVVDSGSLIADRGTVSLTALADGTLLVVHTTFDSLTGFDTSEQGLAGQVLSPTGVPVGPGFVINSNQYGGQDRADVTINAFGRAVAIWYSFDYISAGIAAASGMPEFSVRTITFDTATGNHAPVVSGPITFAAVVEDTSVTITAAQLLANTTDIDVGDTLSVTNLTVTAGTLTLTAPGTWLYTPAANDDTAVTFNYSVTDGSTGRTTRATMDLTPQNDAPVVAAAIANQSFAEDSVVNFTLPAGTFTDVDGNALTLTALLSDGSALPAWLSFDAALQSFTGTPPQDFNGDFAIAVTASDGVLSTSSTFTLNIAAANDAPVATSSPVSGDEDFTINGTVTATDVDSPVLTFALVNGPAHGSLTLMPDGGYIYTPAGNYNGTDSFTYRASDGAADSNVATVTLTIAAVNDAPVAGTLADKTFGANVPVSVTLPADTFTDVDNATLTLTAKQISGAALPGWLMFNPATQVFSGTPPLNFNGDIDIAVTATDAGGLFATSTFRLHAGANNRPVLNPYLAGHAVFDQFITPNAQLVTSIYEQAAAGTVVSYVTGTEPDGQSITFSLVNDAGGRFSINAQTGVIQVANGTLLDRAQALTHSITVRATDAEGLNALQDRTFTVKVLDRADAPFGLIGGENAVNDQSAGVQRGSTTAALSNGNLIVTWYDFGTNTGLTQPKLMGQLFDSAGQEIGTNFVIAAGFDHVEAELTYTVQARPDGGFVSYVALPQGGSPVSMPLELRIFDAAGVQVGQPIDVDALGIRRVADLASLADGKLAVIGTNTAGTNISFRIVAPDGSPVSPLTAIFAPGADFNDSSANIQALDNGNLVVICRNYVQVYSATGAAIGVQSRFPASDSAHILPLENGGFVLAGSSFQGGILGYVHDALGQQVGPPINFGTTPLVQITGQFQIATLENGGFVVVRQAFQNYTISADGSLIAGEVYGDADGSSISATFHDGAGNMVGNPFLVNRNTFGEQAFSQYDFIDKIAVLANGNVAITWQGLDVIDPTTGTFSPGIRMQIIQVPPILINTAPVAVDGAGAGGEDTAIAGTLLATDVDNNTLIYQVVTGPAHGTVVLTGSGYVYTPAGDYNGTDSFSYKANDGTADSNTAIISLTITPVNDAPIVAVAIADQAAAEDATFSFQLPPGTFADVDTANLTLTTSALPDWLSFNAATRTFSGIPINADVGVVNVTVTAFDGALATSDVVAIAVTNTNDAPTVSVAIADQGATAGTLYSYVLPTTIFADVDIGDAIGLTAAGLPVWMSFDAATRTLSGTPAAGEIGSVNVTIIATDLAGASVSNVFALNVVGANTPPITGTNGSNTLIGTSENNIINGLGGNDIVFGIDGDDLLNGGNGNDRVYGGNGSDTLLGESGNDRLYGRSGSDSLFGGAGNDSVYGGAGDDTLIGGTGSDWLRGGSGADTFVFVSAAESVRGGNRDQIQDFSRGIDRIDLAAIDANFSNGVITNDAFVFIGSAAFTGQAGQLRFANGIVSGDRNGNGTSDFEVAVNVSGAMTAGDFIL